jgi:selenocysteine lyase/cysteine desulfurase
MKLLLNIGIENIEKRILNLTDYLIDCLQDLELTLQTPTDKQFRSGIVNFRAKNPQKMAEKLNEKGIVVSARSNGIRVSPHFYNTEAEIDTLIAEIKKSEG